MKRGSRAGSRRLPLLAIIDGKPGLHAALRAQWLQLPIQRCTAHKLRNLLSRAPAPLCEEVAEDYRRMMYGKNREVVESATEFSEKMAVTLCSGHRQCGRSGRGVVYLFNPDNSPVSV